VPAPPLYDSDQYWSEAKEVWVASLRLSAEQRALADYWHLDKGSVTPAGLWNRKVLALLQRASCAPGQDARVLAAANVAMHDALIAAWHVKYRYWTLRPVNAIRERYDPHFLPYLITPAFPAYVSGHATVSAAAAEVLSHYFPEHAHALRAMAQDVADSRLYGGIHFRSDNEEGLRLGRQVGRVVVQRIERDPDAQWLAPTARTAGR
jgi:membrane-associated phospholipid phosphatase